VGNQAVAVILFALAVILVVMGWVIQGLPPVITAIGFAVIGYHVLRSKR
jgi:hypothetical protein